jgi:FtsH ternary system-associated peptide
MILLFPNLDTLRLSLSSSIVPMDVTLAPAKVTYDDQGKIYLESDANLTRTVTKNLDRIGVKGSKRHATDSPEVLSCWPQALPLVRETETPAVSSQAAVLFELSDADDLPVLATEMLRLGNDRQGFRWFAEPGDTESKRVLLRVIGPPYYTLLRALDKSAAGTKGTVRAYLERAPRAWIEIGQNHPLAGQIRVAEKQLLLIRTPREWVYLDDSPFQDVYEIIQFQLPASPVEWAEAKAPKKITVPLRLAAGNAADAPELWVLRERAVEQLDALVRDSDDRLTQRLMFAVATDAKGNRTVILRTRPSKLAPPHLALENALAFKPFWKLPNLFVPIGRRLHPTLRRDAVRRLLAGDPDQVVWLAPNASNGFMPESIPDGAFRQLEDWVDYVIESDRKPLAAWIEATRFDFEQFICTDTGGPRPKPDRGDKEKEEEETRGPRGAIPQPKASSRGKPAAKPSTVAEYVAPPEEIKKPSEWKIRRAELEKQFQEVEGGLDAPERQALWPKLAVASAGIPELAESAICWLNAMWNTDPIPVAWLGSWARSESSNPGGTIKAEEFDKALASHSVGQAEARALVASFLWLAAQKPVPGWLNARLPAVQSYLERNEIALPVRAVWLAAYRLAQLSGSDVLGLARVRDRLLNRLLTEGLSPEKDLPSFLRYAGHKDSERMRVVREKALDLHAAVRKWSQIHPQNLPYIDLLFAFALARLQETSAAKRLVEDARNVMLKPVGKTSNDYRHVDELVDVLVKQSLFAMYNYRIDQVLSGQQPIGEYSAEIQHEMEELGRKAKSSEFKLQGPLHQSMNPYWQAEYIINRLRSDSRVLEPQGALHPYAPVTKHNDTLHQEIAQLHSLRDTKQLVNRVNLLLRNGHPPHPMQLVHFFVLREALLFAPRVGEEATIDWLQRVPDVVAAWGATNAPGLVSERVKEQGELIERALVFAGHYGRADIVKNILDYVSKLIHNKKEDERLKLINVIGGQSLRIMKRLGLRDEIDRFYMHLQVDLLRGLSIEELRKQYTSKPETWSRVLQTSLSLASGWLSFGMTEPAKPILTEARNLLLGKQTSMRFAATEYTLLARSYVSAIGQGPSESGMVWLLELFERMDRTILTNTMTTSKNYSRFHLSIIEDVIRAIVSDDFALGPGGRKWLDDDEYLVRRRIHADMNRERLKSGL